MKETLMRLWGRAAAVLEPLFRKLFAGGRAASLVRGSLFIGAASTIGMYLALTLFVPDDLVLSKLNGALAGQGLAVEAADIDYSPSIAVSLDDGALKSGTETLLTFGELTVSPSLWSVVTGAPSATVVIEDIDGKGGRLTVEVGSGDEPCYRLEADEAPLTLLRALWPEVIVDGTLNGSAEFCREKKLSGEIDITATDTALGGKVYGLELEKSILLGAVEISGIIKENKLDIRKMTALGDLDMEVEGKVSLNPGSLKNSRLELSADLKEKKEGAIKQIPLLELALSRFKDPGGGYSMKISGQISGPSVRRDSRANRPPRNAKPNFGNGADKDKKREKEKEKEKEKEEKITEKSPTRGAEKEPEPEPEEKDETPVPDEKEKEREKEKDKEKNTDTEEKS
jgi:type II secretion system protein N